MNDRSRLLKEYISNVLNEAASSREHFSTYSYSGSTETGFEKTFVEPFKDLFTTTAAVLAQTANVTASVVLEMVSKILYSALPDFIAQTIVPRVDDILRREREYAEAIRQKYDDVFERNAQALFRGDAAYFAFFADPALFLTGAALIKAPAAVGSVLDDVAGNERIDPATRSSITSVATRLKAQGGPKNEAVLYEQGVTNDDLVAIRRILRQPRVARAIHVSFAEPRREAMDNLNAMQQQILDDFNTAVGQDADRLADMIAMQLAQTLQDDADIAALQPQLQAAARQGLKDAYINVLRQRAAEGGAPERQLVFDKLIARIQRS